MTIQTAELPLLSIVIPAFNESLGISTTLKKVVETVSQLDITWQIIVVDDGSRDATFQQVQQLAIADPRIQGIALSRNFGKESALLAGLQYATGKAVITIDADLQHPVKMIPQMLAKWQQGAKIVHAVKQKRNAEPLSNKLRAWVINNTISWLGGIDINNSSDSKLLDREIVDIIVQHLPERERFYRGLASWVGFEQEYLFFDVESREGDQSKWSFWALCELSITALTSFTCLPLRIITFLGFATLMLGFVIGVEALWSHFQGQAVSGFATLITSLLLIGSFIMISLGIIGEYIAKIYEEVKARPLYFIKANTAETKNTVGGVKLNNQSSNEFSV